MRSLVRWCVLMGIAAFMPIGCTSTPSPTAILVEAHPIEETIDVPPDEDRTQVPPEPEEEISTATLTGPEPIENVIRSEVMQWQGTPHRMGGTNRGGIDCSGFVQRLYRDLFDRQIPRSTALQSRSGQGIGKEELRTGDLVFFNLPRIGKHVGIYLGKMEFAHASTSEGVTISNLEDPFWRQSYWTARRYLDATH